LNDTDSVSVEVFVTSRSIWIPPMILPLAFAYRSDWMRIARQVGAAPA